MSEQTDAAVASGLPATGAIGDTGPADLPTRARPAVQAGLEEELALLRSCMRRVAANIEAQPDEDEHIELLIKIVRAITAAERVRLLGRGHGPDVLESIQRAMRALGPRKL